MRIIDLSITLENDAAWAPRWGRNRVKYQGHKFGRFAMWLLFGVRSRDLKTGLGWANETIKLSTHGTTHVDAPWHYGPDCEGKPARTIDEMPLDWFFGSGVVLDIRHLEPDAAATIVDLQEGLQRINYTLRPNDIVLVQTGNDRLRGSPDYFSKGPGVSPEATRWLLDQGVRLTGIDAWGWDRPLAAQAQEAKKTGRDDVFWAAHYVGTDREYCHIERLANLDQLPPTGFRVCAFPLKVKRGSAGPARVVALVDE